MQKEVILVQANKSQPIIEDSLISLKLGTDISTIVTGLAAIAGVVIAGYQLGRVVDNLKLQKQEITLDHERKLRENAVNHALRWTNLPIEADSASRVAEKLDNKQIEKLFNFEEIEIGEKNNLKFLKDIFGEDYQFSIESNNVKLGIKEVTKLRYYVKYWMNTLESILIAYRHNIADRKIIEEEFEGCILKDRSKEFFLKNVYEQRGKENAFPGIADFLKSMEKKHSHQPTPPLATPPLPKVKI